MYERLELRRLSDDRVYTFRRVARGDGTVGYKRDDAELWIVFRATLGWVVFDERKGEVTGMPWGVALHDQREKHPPVGEWVGKKDAKAYVYRLRYLDK
jgi:hypothetical protein